MDKCSWALVYENQMTGTKAHQNKRNKKYMTMELFLKLQ